MARSLAANSVEAVRDTTREAFILYGERRNYRDAIDKLMKLEGVSFTIATLILNTYDPENLPYFTVRILSVTLLSLCSLTLGSLV